MVRKMVLAALMATTLLGGIMGCGVSALPGSYVVAGDSLAEGLGNSTGLSTAFGVTWANLGIGGEKTMGLRFRWQSILDSAPKKLILITGGNDVYNNVSLNTTKNNLMFFAESLSTNGIETLMTNMPLLITATATEQQRIDARALNVWMAENISFPNVKVVDIYSWEDARSPGIFRDGAHLTDEGYLQFADYLSTL